MEYEERLSVLEKTVERHSNRLAAIEARTAEDHKTLESVRKDVDEMKNTVEVVKNDVKIIKQQNKATNHSIDKLTKWIKIALCVAGVAFCYSVFRSENTASAIAALTSTIAKFLV